MNKELLGNSGFYSILFPWMSADAQGRIVPSELRNTESALAAGAWVGQKLSATTLIPGQSYAFEAVARSTDITLATMQVVFFTAAGVIYRNYSRTLTTDYARQTVEFVCPLYTGHCEVSFTGACRVDRTSLKQIAAISCTELPVNTTHSYVPPGYTLAFNDEFDGPTLNRDKWFTRYIYNGGTLDYLNDEAQRYRDNGNHIFCDDEPSVLSLTARKTATGYESGMIRSDWTTIYGYFEARVKMPSGIGMWPAFWLNSDCDAQGNTTWPPEIDIFEFVNNGVEDKAYMLHTGVVSVSQIPFLYVDPSFNKQWTFWAAPFDFTEGWHTIGCEWTPDAVTTYVDGLEVVSRANNWDATHGPAHIILDLAIGGAWAGRHGIDDGALPQALKIQWIRAYKK